MRWQKIDIIPSVDIKDGNCVRLFQGDYEQETVFSNDPLNAALRWQSFGAPRLHVVDLNGAADGIPGNIEIIRQIAQATMVPLQVGGGIRRLETIKELLLAGAERVVLGTAAIEDPSLVEEACRKYGDAIIVGIDTREGWVATRGWKIDTKVSGIDLAKSMTKIGVKRFIYTDISRDGTLTEPNFSSIAELISKVGRPVIASGGVASVLHLKMLKQLGAEGAIIGKALYTGDINLKKALEELDNA